MLVGVLLAGGLSERFGRDKYLWRLGEKTIFGRVGETLREVCDEIVISTRSKERGVELVKKTGIKGELSVDRRELGCGGPLMAVASTLSQIKGEDYLIVSGDLPWIKAKSLKKFVRECRSREVDVGSLIWGNGETTPNIIYLKNTMEKVLPKLCRLRGVYSRATDILRASPRLLLLPVQEIVEDLRELVDIDFPDDLRNPRIPSTRRISRGEILLGRERREFIKAVEMEVRGEFESAAKLYSAEAKRYLDFGVAHLALHATIDELRCSPRREAEKRLEDALRMLGWRRD